DRALRAAPDRGAAQGRAAAEFGRSQAGVLTVPVFGGAETQGSLTVGPSRRCRSSRAEPVEGPNHPHAAWFEGGISPSADRSRYGRSLLEPGGCRRAALRRLRV